MLSALLVLLPLGGCGDATSGASAPSAPETAAHWGGCTTEELDQVAATEVATLSIAGERVTVQLVPAGAGPCAGGLVARSDAGVTGTDVSGLGLEPDTARVVELGGAARTRLLLIHGGVHPRGGFQPHLFVVHDGLAEVMVDGNPLLPFVATDGGGMPVTATCRRDGGVDVLTATTSEPPGVVLAWDVQRTSYRLDGSTAESTGTKQVRDHTADPVLRDQMPALFEPDAFFADCVQ